MILATIIMFLILLDFFVSVRTMGPKHILKFGHTPRIMIHGMNEFEFSFDNFVLPTIRTKLKRL